MSSLYRWGDGVCPRSPIWWVTPCHAPGFRGKDLSNPGKPLLTFSAPEATVLSFQIVCSSESPFRVNLLGDLRLEACNIVETACGPRAELGLGLLTGVLAAGLAPLPLACYNIRGSSPRLGGLIVLLLLDAIQAPFRGSPVIPHIT